MKSDLDTLFEQMFGRPSLDPVTTGRVNGLSRNLSSGPSSQILAGPVEPVNPLKFRSLTDEEVSSAKTRIERDCKKLGIPSLVWAFNPDRFKICYQINENYTICLLQADGEVLTTGASRCNPRDQFDEKIGQALSFNRAMSAC